jgi:hypothetical protein
MFKKLTLLAMAIAAVAAVSAPAASAFVSANVEPNEMFTARSTNLVTKSEGGGELKCETVNLFGTWGEEVTEVETLKSSGTISGVAHNKETAPCATHINGVTAHISNISVTNLSLNGTSGSADATFTVTLTAGGSSVGHCHYEGKITFSTNDNAPLSLTLTGEKQLTQTLEGTCPIAAKGAKATISGTLAVTKGTTTDGSGNAVVLTTSET